MSPSRPAYQELEKRLAAAEPIVEALKRHEVDAVVGEKKIAFLLLREVTDALQNSDAGFRALFELSGVGMAQADAPAFRFTRVNRKFCKIAGYSAEELLGKNYLDLTHPQDRLADMKGLARVLRAKADSWSIEKRCVRKDGGVIWLGVNGAALRDDSGRAVKIMTMVSDITARKQAEQALRDRSEQLRKLASELTLAEQRERRRIARILHDHIEELLADVPRKVPRKAPLARAQEKTVRQVLNDVQSFIDHSIAPVRPAVDKKTDRDGGARRAAREGPMKTLGEIEAAACQSMSRFAQEYMGRGPKDVHAHLIGDLLVVRLQGVLTAAEQHLVKTLQSDKGRDLLKQVRIQLMETSRPIMEAMVLEITGAKVLSLHHDISTVTGEELVVFTLAEPPLYRETKKK